MDRSIEDVNHSSWVHVSCPNPLKPPWNGCEGFTVFGNPYMILGSENVLPAMQSTNDVLQEYHVTYQAISSRNEGIPRNWFCTGPTHSRGLHGVRLAHCLVKVEASTLESEMPKPEGNGLQNRLMTICYKMDRSKVETITNG